MRSKEVIIEQLKESPVCWIWSLALGGVYTFIFYMVLSAVKSNPQFSKILFYIDVVALVVIPIMYYTFIEKEPWNWIFPEEDDPKKKLLWVGFVGVLNLCIIFIMKRIM